MSTKILPLQRQLVLILFIFASLISSSAHCDEVLQLPPTIILETDLTPAPQAGLRVAVVTKEYAATEVHHMLYLPKNWTKDLDREQQRWPVIVEFTGNEFLKAGSTGKMEDAALGYGISGGNFIWVTLPYIAENHQENQRTWWGDLEATVEYATTNIPRICQEFNGDPNLVFVCGFSRGAIATNLIGLHDDHIAKLWCGFITHDHYDGVREWHATTWGTPLDAYQMAAAKRLARIGERPVLICQSGNTTATHNFLQQHTKLDHFQFLVVNTERILGAFPNEFAIHPHNDRWLLKPSSERDVVWKWVREVIKTRS